MKREDIARAICVAENVDPDKETVGIGSRIPVGQRCKLWEVRLPQADAVLELMEKQNG